jgi:hypothetical protein
MTERSKEYDTKAADKKTSCTFYTLKKQFFERIIHFVSFDG